MRTIKSKRCENLSYFPDFFPHDCDERGACYEVQYHTDGGLAAYGETALRENTDNTTRHTNNSVLYTSGVCVCVCISTCARYSSRVRASARISEGAIFEMSSRRAWDLRSVVVASIITATIVPEFIGISINAARAYFLIDEPSSFRQFEAILFLRKWESSRI